MKSLECDEEGLKRLDEEEEERSHNWRKATRKRSREEALYDLFEKWIDRVEEALGKLRRGGRIQKVLFVCLLPAIFIVTLIGHVLRVVGS